MIECYKRFSNESVFYRHLQDVDDIFTPDPGLKDSTLVARKLLTYRHQVVASPSYLKTCKAPRHPKDLLKHRLLAFWWRPFYRWEFTHANGKQEETLSFEPYIGMNDYAGLATALLAGAGIGELPPIVQPELVRNGLLVEVMPSWHLPIYHLSLVHLGNRYIPRHVRVFKEFVGQMAPKLFPKLPA